MQVNTSIYPQIAELSQKVVQAAKDTFGEKLDKVILYGSYARGDYDEESDVDFFILADVPQEEASMWRQNMRDCIPYVDLDYDVTVSLHVTGLAIFNRFINTLPFYMNVTREGVVLSE